MRQKVFPGGRVWGVGCGVWGFTSFEVANYLIFREKVPKQALNTGNRKQGITLIYYPVSYLVL
ncbi:MAG: hypothetical protein EWV45_05605 [Microcystis flos-aquae Mf_QC_C_20070823_S10D]|uniref:Type IV pilin PilA n=1 Tax=Microcystis flos-aquae Mf_QC_C_20070823_S10D TaxID=2486236 RepID=A0A552L243_9CHRO|nr:MAG: hypothetical protein EWV45_05605 [Microcystis flos-aquae Mf_QC_C_20070823_S10D]